MSLRAVRSTSVVLLALCCCFYVWLSLRTEPRLATIPIFPHAVSSYLDLKPLHRSFPAFFVLAMLAAGSVAGSCRRVQLFVLTGSLLAPLMKDVMQIGLATRHFNQDAIFLGMLGAISGFGIGYLLLRMLVLYRKTQCSYVP